MEQIILDQIMKLSRQMEKMHSELCAKIDANSQRLNSLEQKMDAKFKEQDEKFEKLIAENTARIERIIEENAKDTDQIFHDVFRNLGEEERKIINLYK